MKKYIAPVSEVITLVTEQMLALSFGIYNETVEDQWSQKDGLDDDIDWDSEDK